MGLGCDDMGRYGTRWDDVGFYGVLLVAMILGVPAFVAWHS